MGPIEPFAEILGDGGLRRFWQRAGISRAHKTRKLALGILTSALERERESLATTCCVDAIVESQPPAALAATLDAAPAHDAHLRN